MLTGVSWLALLRNNSSSRPWSVMRKTAAALGNVVCKEDERKSASSTVNVGSFRDQTTPTN
jgi:hypothetical protein